ncbi:MAG: NAD(+) diphosphatase [Propionibacteriales bacterium]|nr:NAD(+) diphosphatase [Propionibacteriales bacterium]
MSHWKRAGVLDRCEGRRDDPAWVAELWRAPGSGVIGVDAEGRVDGDHTGVVVAPTEGAFDSEQHFLLGLWDGAAVFARAVPSAGVGLRALIDELSEDQLQLAFAAVGLIGWHQRAGFCPACGTASRVILGGLARRCPSCDIEDYPRSDAAVIMAVTDADDRLLLARQAAWPPGRYSVLAGFAEVGESLEQTVHREVAEEVGVELETPTYLGSQPWPFPRSLMVAFAARAVSPELRPSPTEIEDAHWVTRAELREQLAAGALSLPMAASIARRMIEAWLADELNPQRVG